MSDDSSAAIRDTRKKWMLTHREDYLRSGGSLGHIADLSTVEGGFTRHLLLIKYVGRKSGNIFITPLCYGVVGGEIVIVASKGGADHHPDSYLNLIEKPEVEFQVGTQAWRVSWREPEAAVRDKV
jgi:deazaflavin-dependent oxidoreductase (nitroreductase family)